MKKSYLLSIKGLVLVFALLLPTVFYGQGVNKTIKADFKTEKNTKLFDKYWAVTPNVGMLLFHGDITENAVLPESSDWRLGGGAYLTRQFTSLFGLRGQFLIGKLAGTKTAIDREFETNTFFETNLNATLSFSNLFAGYRADRFANIYGFAGIGFSNSESELTAISTGTPVNMYGDDESGSLKHTTETTVPVGLGIDFRLADNWDLNLESGMRFSNGSELDAFPNDNKKAYKNDMYSYTSLGVTWKFARQKGIKKMAKTYAMDPEPFVLERHGDSVLVSIKGNLPEKYFHKKAAMNFTPTLVFGNDSLVLKSINFQGEDVMGDGVMIAAENGGSYTYETYVPYQPEMEASELVVNPIVYSPKEAVSMNATMDEVKTNAKDYIVLGRQKLADGIIVTGQRVMHDENALYAAHGYEKETIVTKKAMLYFPKNRHNLNWNLSLNKENEVKAQLEAVKDFIKQGWEIKDIDINAWASPEGEESFNQGLSEKRSIRGQKQMARQFKKLLREKDSPVQIKDPMNEVKFNSYARGEDWDGFMKSVQASNIQDKNIILNVVKSQTDLAQREQEIRNMTLVYGEIEDEILPPLRRVEMAVNCFEPKKSDEQIAELSTSNPAELDNKELLFAATLTNDLNTKLAIYENAMKVYAKDWRGYNNAAAVLLMMNNTERAQSLLEQANQMSPNNPEVINNMGVVASMNKDYTKALTYYAEAEKLGADASYNKGIAFIPKGKYDQALTSLRSAKCSYNLALAQLMSDNNNAAITTLDCAKENAQVHYLKAVVAARNENTSAMYESLVKAFTADASLKAQAQKDREFVKYFAEQDFINAIK